MTTASSEITEGCTDMLLSFHIFSIFGDNFSYFVIFSTSVLVILWVKRNAVPITSVVSLCPSVNSTVNVLNSKVHHLIINDYYYSNVIFHIIVVLTCFSSYTL